MNTALPVNNAKLAPATGTIGNAARSMLASVLTAFLKHSRSMDGNEQAFVATDAAAKDNKAAQGTLKSIIARLSENEAAREQRLFEAEMSQATDLYDLEFRSREWDRKARSR